MGVMYRAEFPDSEVYATRSSATTRRAPANVPYLVDNLWEWKRPRDFPSRRFSVFASPLAELALKSAGEGRRAYRVELLGEACIAQVNVPDSKDHPDCRTLRGLVKQLLGQSWIDAALSAKLDAGRLFIPCLTDTELDELFSTSRLREVKTQLWNGINYWEDVRLVHEAEPWPYPNGELFFKADNWRLVDPEIT